MTGFAWRARLSLADLLPLSSPRPCLRQRASLLPADLSPLSSPRSCLRQRASLLPACFLPLSSSQLSRVSHRLLPRLTPSFHETL